MIIKGQEIIKNNKIIKLKISKLKNPRDARLLLRAQH
jgi:hypothetical protein